MKLGSLSRSEICSALAGLSGSTARVAAQELADRLGVSVAAIYRITREVRAGGRKARSDRGAKKVAVEPHIEKFMMGLTYDKDFSADHVLFTTAKHFGLPKDFLSVSTYNAWLRAQMLSRRDRHKDRRPYRSWEWQAGNAVHQYDTTVAPAFYLNDDGSIGCEPGHQRYKNKPGNRRPRLILYSLIDDYSRVIYGRFYASENSYNLLDFVFHAWSQKEDRRFPFYGIPTGFYADQGSPSKSRIFLKALEKLGVKRVETTPAHWTPHGSRKHGKIERTFGAGLWGEFTKNTAAYRFANLAELNAAAFDWLVHINNKRHSVTGEARFARWLRTVGTPRSMPSQELFDMLHWDTAERTVTGNLQISFNGRKFQLPYRRPFINWVECKVQVYWHPHNLDKVMVCYDSQEIELGTPIIDIGGEYRSVAKTDLEEKIEDVSGQNYSTVNFATIYRDDSVPYVPRKGEEFDEKKIAKKEREASGVSGEASERPRYSFSPERYLDRISAFVELRNSGFFYDGDAGGDYAKKRRETDRAWLLGVFGERERISETELNAAVALAREAAEREVV